MRKFLPQALMLAGLCLSGTAIQASGVDSPEAPKAGTNKDIKVFASPTCGCCKHWVSHLEKHGFKVQTHFLDDMQSKKNELGVPAKLRSCHTGVINGLVVEGHVPAADITRTVAFVDANSNSNVAGISVPGMPHGSPGMETGRTDPFATIGFTHEGHVGVISEYGNR